MTEADRKHLKSYECKSQLLRDRVGSVVGGYATGLFAHGPGGHGKSHNVKTELVALGANYHLVNSKLTGPQLFAELEKYPDAIHWYEDCERLLHDSSAVGVLRSALAGQRRDGETGPIERSIDWAAKGQRKSIIFTGGIIIVFNRDLSDTPESQALGTRVPCLHFLATDPELRAVMIAISEKGYRSDAGGTMTPAESCEVCEYILGETQKLDTPLDLRLLTPGGFGDYMQWRAGDSGCHWHDLVRQRIQKRTPHFREPVRIGSRAERLEEDRQLFREILARHPDDHDAQFADWEQHSELGLSTFYERRKEVLRERKKE